MDAQLQQLKLLKPWGNHKKGAVVKVDSVRAWQLQQDKLAEPYVAEKAGAFGRSSKHKSK